MKLASKNIGEILVLSSQFTWDVHGKLGIQKILEVISLKILIDDDHIIPYVLIVWDAVHIFNIN